MAVLDGCAKEHILVSLLDRHPELRAEMREQP
jgi:hypothetical protein